MRERIWPTGARPADKWRQINNLNGESAPLVSGRSLPFFGAISSVTRQTRAANLHALAFRLRLARAHAERRGRRIRKLENRIALHNKLARISIGIISFNLPRDASCARLSGFSRAGRAHEQPLVWFPANPGGRARASWPIDRPSADCESHLSLVGNCDRPIFILIELLEIHTLAPEPHTRTHARTMGRIDT